MAPPPSRRSLSRQPPAPLRPAGTRASLLGSHTLPNLPPVARSQADLAAQQIRLLLSSPHLPTPPRTPSHSSERASSSPEPDGQPSSLQPLPPITEPLPRPRVALISPLSLKRTRSTPLHMLTLRLPSTPDRSRPPPPYESPRPSSPGSEVERERQHLEEAAAHTFYRTCFWPLHVWKRSCRCALSARRMFCQRVLHLFRAHALATWKLHAGTQWTMERALLAMATSSYLHNLERCFETWLERWESTCEYIQMGSSEQFHMLRMRSLVGLPFNILRTYALCKIIVRRRSYGACLLEEEAKVPPIVFPPLASDDVCQPFYAKALREDPQQRKANRFMRQRLARPIFNSFALQVEWRRKKRFSLLCGWHLTYRQILARWISFVILDLGDEDDIEGEQLAVHACEQLRDTSGLDREEIYALKRARFTARLSRRRMGRTCGTWLKQRHETAALGGGGGRLSAGVRSHVGRWRSVRAEKLARRDSLEGWKRPTAQERFDGFIRQAQKKVNQASLERDEVIARLHQMKKRSKREQEAARVSELVLHTRQAALRVVVEMQSSQLEEVLSRNQDEVEAMVSRRGEKLLAVYTRTKQQFDLLLLRETVVACFHALSVPMRWRRAVHVSNKLRLKRWLRICVRFRWVYEHIHIYRKYRILSAILWAWLKLIERYYTYRTPGLVRSLKIRRSRVSLFSRLLLAGKHPTCARSLFARWLEWTQTRKAARATVHLTSLITNQRLLRRCFDGFVVSVASSCVRGVSVEERAWADREAWVSFFLRPGLYSSWVRRKERWERARAERMAPAKVTAVAVTDLRAQQAARVAVERDLLFNTQVVAKSVEFYWAGAVKLRELELRERWKRSEALLRYLVFQLHKEDMVSQRDQNRPTAYPELQKPNIAIGLARWSFNAVSHRLPKYKANASSVQLPPNDDSYYWEHIDRLVDLSAVLTAKSRVISSGAATFDVVYNHILGDNQTQQ